MYLLQLPASAWKATRGSSKIPVAKPVGIFPVCEALRSREKKHPLKSNFKNVPIECWVQAGRGLGRTQPCICVRAESPGAGIMLSAVNDLASGDAPAARKLTLQSERKDAFPEFRLRLSPTSNELRNLAVMIEDDIPTLEFTRAGLPAVTSALELWIEGNEDFCLHPRGKGSEVGVNDQRSGEMWFWVTMLP